MKKYTTERGVTIGVVPIPLLLEEIRQAHSMEPAPTYTEHLAGGATQEVEITDAQAEVWAASDPETWAPHAEKWAEYQEKRDARTKRLNEVLWRAVMRKAIVVELPKDDQWIRDQTDMDISVPEDPVARMDHYIWTEVLGGQEDLLRLMGLAAGVTLTEEQLAAVEASFWNTLERPATR